MVKQKKINILNDSICVCGIKLYKYVCKNGDVETAILTKKVLNTKKGGYPPPLNV